MSEVQRAVKMAVWNAEQVADLLMCESSDDGGNESSVVDSEDSEFRISSSGGEDPTVSSETESTDSENRTYVTRGRSRAKGSARENTWWWS